jgi:hypothetical protein
MTSFMFLLTTRTHARMDDRVHVDRRPYTYVRKQSFPVSFEPHLRNSRVHQIDGACGSSGASRSDRWTESARRFRFTNNNNLSWSSLLIANLLTHRARAAPESSNADVGGGQKKNVSKCAWKLRRRRRGDDVSVWSSIRSRPRARERKKNLS